MRKFRVHKRLLGVLAGLLVLSASVARADFLFTIDTGNLGGLDAGTGPYATALVHLVDATHATVTFDSLDDGTNTYLMGAENAVDVNVNASTWSLDSATGTNSFPVFSPGPYSDGGAGTVDGFGSFNQTVNSFDGYTHSATQVILSLTNTGGTWADASSVLIGNASGFSVGIHGFACVDPCDAGTDAAFTGFGTNGEEGGGGGGGGPIPEPVTLILLGPAMVLTFAKLRKKLARS